jgi:hypothetical protein
MAFLPTSRYAHVATVETEAAGGRPVAALKLRRLPAPPADADPVVVQPHDRIDILAQTTYGDGAAAWRIADANSELEARRLIEAGRRIWVPKPV